MATGLKRPERASAIWKLVDKIAPGPSRCDNESRRTQFRNPSGASDAEVGVEVEPERERKAVIF